MDLLFLDMGIMLILATIVAYIARRYKQPLIPAYIMAGVFLGPGLSYIFGLDFVQSLLSLPKGFVFISNNELIVTLSEIGIAFLLFIVGLEIDLKKLQDSEKVSVFGGVIQILILFSAGFVASIAMGIFTYMEAIYVGIAVAFSSTMVVLKILSDRKELDTLHGRIIIGILLVQDVFAILALIILSGFSGTEGFSDETVIRLVFSLVGGLAILVVGIICNKYFFPKLFKSAAKSQEILLLTSLAVCFGFSLLFAKLGYSIAIGAFIAGIFLGNLPYSFEIIGRVKSLRDFFATLFFVSLGVQLSLTHISGIIIPLLVLLILIVLIKPAVIMFSMFAFGYKRRTSFLSAISLAQTSEFALIIVTQGRVLGHVSPELFSLLVVLIILTIFFSSYFIKYEYKIYSIFNRDLAYFERMNTHEDNLELSLKGKSDVLLVGYSRTGYDIFKKLRDMKKKLSVVDFNPEIIKKLIKEKIPCIYGDIANHEILEKIDFKNLKFVISTIPDPFPSKLLIKYAKKRNPEIVVFVTSYHVEDALSLYEMGADYVILPHFLGGYHASVLLEEVSLDLKKLMHTKSKHLKELHVRKDLGHSYPTSHKHVHYHDHKHKKAHK